MEWRVADNAIPEDEKCKVLYGDAVSLQERPHAGGWLEDAKHVR